MCDIPTIQTARLTLRAFRLDDLAGLHSIHQDPLVMKHTGGTERFSDETATRDYMAMRLGDWRLHGYGRWAVEERSTGCLVGRAGPATVKNFQEPELGWTLARHYWGKGYATEAANASLGYLFDSLGVDRVISLIAPANTASIAVAERIGERFEGRVLGDGEVFCLYALNRRDRPQAVGT